MRFGLWLACDEVSMKSQAIDDLIGALGRLSSENLELARRMRALEHLLSLHNKLFYQEYMNWINYPKNRTDQSGQISLDKLRQALLQDRE
jgi:hypothetical protein